MSGKLSKWSSTLLIASGILLAVPILFHPNDSTPGFALDPAWVPVHLFLGLSLLIGVAGLFLFYRALYTRLSVTGHIAFVVTILGSILMAGLMIFVEAGIVPVLAGNVIYEPLLSMSGPLMTGMFASLMILSILIMSVGNLLLAGYLATTRTISYVNALFFIGAPLAGFTPPFPYAVGIFGGVILGIGIVWLGVSIRNGIAHKAIEEGMHEEDECIAHAGHA